MSIRANPIDFKMGADPEFCCLQGQKLLTASEITRSNSRFGADGSGTVFEVRPYPSTDPLILVHNIRNLFQEKIGNKPEFLEYNWRAGSCSHGQPMGGHIHFGTRHNVDAIAAAETLSQYVGACTMLVENKMESIERRNNNNSYGGYKDVRETTYGFEYRTPSSWITSPYVAASVLCLAKTVMFEKLNNASFSPRILIRPDDINYTRTDNIRSQFSAIWEEITKMHLYQTYKPYIDVLYFLITHKRSWFPASNLHQAWGLGDVREIIPNKVPLNLIWSRYKAQRTAVINN